MDGFFAAIVTAALYIVVGGFGLWATVEVAQGWIPEIPNLGFWRACFIALFIRLALLMPADGPNNS